MTLFFVVLHIPTMKRKELFVSTASPPLFSTLRSVAGKKVDKLGALSEWLAILHVSRASLCCCDWKGTRMPSSGVFKSWRTRWRTPFPVAGCHSSPIESAHVATAILVLFSLVVFAGPPSFFV